MRIDNKAAFYRLAFEGKCGNTPIMWRTVEDYWPHRRRYPRVGVRRTSIACETLTPGIHFSSVHDYVQKLPEGTYVISEVPPRDTARTIQGELSWAMGTWHLYYTDRGGFMRTALRLHGAHEHGLKALNLLRAHLPAVDFEDLMGLFDRYTNGGYEYPVIEFSLLRGCSAGRIPGRSVLIWEIRHY